MNAKSNLRGIFALLVLLLCASSAQAQVPLLIKCEGRLYDDGKLMQGDVEMTLRVYTNATKGDYLYEDVSQVTVEDGIYSTFLGDNTTRGDLTKALATGEAYLEVKANTTTFSPRERLVTVPYALLAGGVVQKAITDSMIGEDSVLAHHIGTGAIGSDKLADGSVTGDKIARGSITPDKLAIPFWTTQGNEAQPGETLSLGTTDKTPLDLKVEGRRALRVAPSGISPHLIGGHEANSALEGTVGASISGGGDTKMPNKTLADFASIGGGQGNQAAGTHATVAGGLGNEADGKRSTVSGGRENQATEIAATVGGGYSNQAVNSYATIAGGYGNYAEGNVSTIPGGWNNFAAGAASVVGGGQDNQAMGPASAISGGFGNKTAGLGSSVGGGKFNQATGDHASVGGGISNIASGAGATIPGGTENSASGKNSFAAGSNATASGPNSVAIGQGAQAKHPGAVVIADSSDVDFASTAADQVLLQAKGNVGIGTTRPDEKLTVNGNVKAEAVYAKSFVGDGSQLKGVVATDVAAGALNDKHFGRNAAISPAKIIGEAVTKKTKFGGNVLTGTIDDVAIAPGSITRDMLEPSLLPRNWAMAGNRDVKGGTDFIGSLNNAPFEIRVNGKSALFIMPGPEGPSILGGDESNQLKAGVSGGFIGAGKGNKVLGNHATVPGGINNTARGVASLAAGQGAVADHDNTFVWSGNPNGSTRTTGPGQFLIDAPGKVGINTDAPSETLTVGGNVKAVKFIGDGSGLTGIQTGVKEGEVGNAQIADNAAVAAEKIAGTALTMKTRFDGAVVGTSDNLQIVEGGIMSGHISPGTITDETIAKDANIDPSKIKGGVLSANAKFSGDVSGSMDNLKLNPGSVKNSALAADAAIDPTKIAGRAITLNDIMIGEIEGPANDLKIKPGVVGNQHLAGDIDPTKIKGTAVTLATLQQQIKANMPAAPAAAPVIAAGSIDSAKIQDGTVGNADLAGNIDPTKVKGTAVTLDKLEQYVQAMQPAPVAAPPTGKIDFKDVFTIDNEGRTRLIMDGKGNFSMTGVQVLSADSANVILGATENHVGEKTRGALIGGGSADQPNRVGGDFGAALGGRNNLVSGKAAATVGGEGNEAAGDYSLAVGRSAKARHSGSVVVSAGGQDPVESTAANQFLVRASGGIELQSSDAGTGVALPAGSGAFSSLSDRNAKQDFKKVEGRKTLEQLSQLPIFQYKYKAQADQGVEHIGPTAQDFQQAFGVGENDRHISTVDADGVALSAIQGLYEMLQDKDRQIEQLTEQNRQMAEQMTRIESLLEKMAQE